MYRGYVEKGNKNYVIAALGGAQNVWADILNFFFLNKHFLPFDFMQSYGICDNQSQRSSALYPRQHTEVLLCSCFKKFLTSLITNQDNDSDLLFDLLFSYFLQKLCSLLDMTNNYSVLNVFSVPIYCTCIST